jgi:hypothetical protein
VGCLENLELESGLVSSLKSLFRLTVGTPRSRMRDRGVFLKIILCAGPNVEHL